MEINEKFIKISSKLPIVEDISLGQDIMISIKGKECILNAVKEEFHDQQDGTMDKVTTLKYLGD